MVGVYYWRTTISSSGNEHRTRRLPRTNLGADRDPFSSMYASIRRVMRLLPSLMSVFSKQNILTLLNLLKRWIAEQDVDPAPAAEGDITEQSQSQAQAHPPPRLEPSHQRWLFWLLVRLDRHLVSESISDLRELARACISLAKASSGQSGEPMVGYWMAVSAITGVWGQKDIWEEARAAFAVPRAT